jgi:uncharacterized protein YegP (UPF0339 family)
MKAANHRIIAAGGEAYSSTLAAIRAVETVLELSRTPGEVEIRFI